MKNYVTADEAVKVIKPGNRVFIHGGAATPHHLLEKMVERASELWGVELISITLLGEVFFTDKKYKNNFRANSLFVSQKNGVQRDTMKHMKLKRRTGER